MRGKWKLLALDGKPVELFDVEADPNEKRNIMADHPDLVASLSAQLTQWLSAPRTTQ
jgi:N-acetylgalactosamine-6-sulfatase